VQIDVLAGPVLGSSLAEGTIAVASEFGRRVPGALGSAENKRSQHRNRTHPLASKYSDA